MIFPILIDVLLFQLLFNKSINSWDNKIGGYIVNEYIKNDEKIYHFDVYRLSDLEEFYDMRTEMNIMIDHYVL